jgi:hypothetical protein
MERSRFATSDLREEPNRAVGRVAGEALPPEIPILASGGLYSSANDLARFLRFQLAHGEPLLGRSAWEALHEIAAPVSAFQSNGYGLGVVVRRVDGRMVAASHSGGGYGFASEVMWMPGLGVGFAVLQTTRGGREIVDAVTRLVVERVIEMAGRDPFAEGDAEPVDCLPGSPASQPRGAWVGRGTQVVTTSKRSEFGIVGSTFQPLCPVAGGRLAHPERGLRDSYQVEAGRDGRPVRLIGLESGSVYDYNDGPGDAPGPGRKRWRSLLGTYEHAWWGRLPNPLTLRERNGSLYFDDLRLFETEPQLFVASNGEVLDLRGEPPSWRSVRIRKLSDPPTQEARNALVERALGLFQLMRDGNREAFLTECAESLRAVLESASSDLWSAHREAPEPMGVEIDDFGATTRALLLIPNEEAVRRVEMHFDGADQLAGLLFLDDAPRTWWHWARSGAP